MEGSPLTQYSIQLFRYGFHDDLVGQNTTPIDVRSKQLESHGSRWSCLEPAEEMPVDLFGALGAYELMGGVFSTVTGEERKSLRFIRLPSVSRGITQKEWRIDDFPMPIDCYATDPSSDLLIVYEDQSSTHSR